MSSTTLASPNRQRIEKILERLSTLDVERAVLQSELAELEKQPSISTDSIRHVRRVLSPDQKIEIFLNLFRGRTDVFPKRWDNQKTGKSGYAPACKNEWVRGICNKPQIKCGECPNQAFIPVSADIARKHLQGDGSTKDHTIGVYPMLKDETCWFLAADFDKENWRKDVSAFLESCGRHNVPASVERSRSGNGAHVWIFFDVPISASIARRMGMALLTETMERCPEMGFESYDRFFPNQDTMPSGGFGNLIALPLQRLPREKENSLFLDERFEPYLDQWAYLSGVRRMSFEDVDAIATDASMRGRVLGVRMPLEEDDDEKPWQARPSRVKADIPIDKKLPASIDFVLGNQLYILKENIPPALINRLIRLAAFQNPEFYSAQAMRLSTFGKPRIIACAEILPKYIVCHVDVPTKPSNC